MESVSSLQKKALPSATPESVGISSRHIAAYLQRLREMDYDLHSLQIFRHGRLAFARAAEPYTLQSPHRLLSAAKGIIAAAVLFAIDEGSLAFNDCVADYFKELLPENLDERYRRMTVYDLLTMQSGQETDEVFMRLLTNPDEELCRNFFRAPMHTEPGSHFFYNNSIPHLLFYMAERASGQDIGTWLDRKLCKPLGIRICVQYNKMGIYDPVTTVISPEDFMKLTVWFLQEGRWGDRQLIDPALIRTACTQQVFTGSTQTGYQNGKGYCMQLWKNAFGGSRMDGGGGQMGIMIPEQDMAVAFTSNDGRGSQAIDLLYDEVIAKLNGRPLPQDEQGSQMLAEAAKGMNRAPYGARAEWIGFSQIDGGVYIFDNNELGLESLSLTKDGERYLLSFMQNGRAGRVVIGLNGRWEENPNHFLVGPDVSIQNRIYGPDPLTCCFSGGWSKDGLFVFTGKSLASMGEYRFQCQFNNQSVVLTVPRGISAGMKADADRLVIRSRAREDAR